MGVKSTVSLDTVVQRADDIIASDMDGETVMMSLENSAYYGLDTIGSRIWELIALPTSVAQVCSMLVTEFDVALETCQADVLELLNHLYAEKLITVIP